MLWGSWPYLVMFAVWRTIPSTAGECVIGQPIIQTQSRGNTRTHTQACDRVCTCIFHPFCFNPILIIIIRIIIIIITILSGPSFLWTIFEMFLHLSLSPPVLPVTWFGKTPTCLRRLKGNTSTAQTGWESIWRPQRILLYQRFPRAQWPPSFWNVWKSLEQPGQAVQSRGEEPWVQYISIYAYICNIDSLPLFKYALKTHLFQTAFNL